MDLSKKTARLVGFLLIFEVIGNYAGASLYDYLLGDSGYLSLMARHSTQIVLGVFICFIAMTAVLATNAILFPIFKRYNKSLTYLHFGFRIIEFVFTAICWTKVLTLLTLSQQFTAAAGANAAVNQAVASSVLAGYTRWFQLIFFTFNVAFLMFYYILFVAKIIPRAISVFGFISAVVCIILTVIETFGFYSFDDSLLSLVHFFIPLSLIIMAVFLIIKGFSVPVAAQKTALASEEGNV